MEILSVITIVILILSIVLHEVAHGYAANYLGDPTARLAGRLTLNPVPHIDMVGSIILPAVLILTGSNFLFGWAKPVPYNPYNLRNQKWSESFVAAAGPLTNLLLAFIFGILIQFSPVLGLSASFIDIAQYVVFINVLLALFNSIPFPPLDGSKVIMPFLPSTIRYKYHALAMRIQSMGILALFLIIFIFMQFLLDPFFTAVVAVSNFFMGF